MINGDSTDRSAGPEVMRFKVGHQASCQSALASHKHQTKDLVIPSAAQT